jgi:signal transduction histidine kinase
MNNPKDSIPMAGAPSEPPPAERMQMRLMRILHELKVPLIAIRGATQLLEKELSQRELQTRYDYLGDISSWCQLMARLLDNTQLSCQSGSLEMSFDVEATMVYANILIPIIRQSRLLMEARGFRQSRIITLGFDHLPPVFIDRNKMQQVFFNLLNNAIKYAEDDPEAFRVEIEAQQLQEHFLITFRDWGIGIPEGFENAIFEEGVRAPNAIRKDVSGCGLGLWVVQNIVAAHGGTVSVSSLRQPTTFTIQLPASIQYRGRR